MMLSAFVIDYGVQLISRHQIQNAVDAAALAGATALSYDSYTDRSDTGIVKTATIAFAQANQVWDGVPSVGAADVTSMMTSALSDRIRRTASPITLTPSVGFCVRVP